MHKKGIQLNIDLYKNVTHIVDGPFWSLYRGINTESDQPVCLQILHDTFKPDAEAVTYFRQMAAYGKMVHHDDILNLRGYRRINDQHVIEYSHFRGSSIKELLSSESVLPEQRIRQLLVTIGRTLQMAQLLGNSHGCVSPEYILIDYNRENVKIFGFGTHIVSDYLYSRHKQLFMPYLPYWPPEVIRRESINTSRSDSYAFGVLSYYFLTKKLPFKADSLDKIFELKRWTPPNPKELNTYVSDELASLTMKMISVRPESRIGLSTAMDELDFHKDENDYPDLRKSSHMNVITKKINAVGDSIKSSGLYISKKLAKNRKRNFIFLFFALIFLVVSLFIVNRITSKKESELDKVYTNFMAQSSDATSETETSTESSEPSLPEEIYQSQSSLEQEVETDERFDSEMQQQSNAVSMESQPASEQEQESPQPGQPALLHITALSNDTPVDATVFVDNKNVGRARDGSPVIVDQLRAGQTVSVTIKSPNYAEWSKDIELSSGTNKIGAQLSELQYKSVSFKEVPFANTLVVDGQHTLMLPASLDLEYGTHQLNYKDSQSNFSWTTQISVTGNSPETITFSNEDVGKGELLVVLQNANEYGYVFVTIDASDQRHTTPFRTELFAGAHKLSFFRKGHTVSPADTTIVIESDQQLQVNCRIIE